MLASLSNMDLESETSSLGNPDSVKKQPALVGKIKFKNCTNFRNATLRPRGEKYSPADTQKGGFCCLPGRRQFSAAFCFGDFGSRR